MTDQITLPRAELQAALDAMEKLKRIEGREWEMGSHSVATKAINALRSRLAEPASEEAQGRWTSAKEWESYPVSEDKPKFELTQGMKDALAQATESGAPAAEMPDGSIMFINRGEDMPDYSDLNCPACGGSGHVDDASEDKPVALLQSYVSDRPFSAGETFYEVAILDRAKCCDGLELFTHPAPANQDALREARNNILWLLRRLPKAYEEPPHVMRCLQIIDLAIERAGEKK